MIACIANTGHSRQFVCLRSLRSFVVAGLDTQEAQSGVCEKFRASLFLTAGVGYRRRKVRHPVGEAHFSIEAEALAASNLPQEEHTE